MSQRSIINTLGNEQWLKQHESSLKAIFPANWALAADGTFKPAAARLRLRALGVIDANHSEFTGVMEYLRRIRIIEVQKVNGVHRIRANPMRIF